MKRICPLVLLLAACGVFMDDVMQPSVVEVGERFTIAVNGTFDYSGTGWLGIMLPEGIRIDSLRYTNEEGETALLTEPDTTICNWLTTSYPCDSGTRWVAFTQTRSGAVDSFLKYEAQVYAEVTGSVEPAGYLVDYRTGSYLPLQAATDSILDVPLTVTGLAVAEEEVVKPGRHGGQVWPAVFRNRVRVSAPAPDDIGIYDAGGRLVRTLHVEGVGFWDGTHASGSRAAPGTYVVRGRQVSGRVTLVD